VVAAQGEEGAGVEWPFGGEGKTLGLSPYKEPVDFCFSFDFTFAEFCRVCHFKYCNSVFTKNLGISSSFLEKKIISNFFNFLKIFIFTSRFPENR
jgi:hypothetical protein